MSGDLNESAISRRRAGGKTQALVSGTSGRVCLADTALDIIRHACIAIRCDETRMVAQRVVACNFTGVAPVARARLAALVARDALGRWHSVNDMGKVRHGG